MDQEEEKEKREEEEEKEEKERKEKKMSRWAPLTSNSRFATANTPYKFKKQSVPPRGIDMIWP
jgi:hypothetical protein